MSLYLFYMYLFLVMNAVKGYRLREEPPTCRGTTGTEGSQFSDSCLNTETCENQGNLCQLFSFQQTCKLIVNASSLLRFKTPFLLEFLLEVSPAGSSTFIFVSEFLDCHNSYNIFIISLPGETTDISRLKLKDLHPCTLPGWPEHLHVYSHTFDFHIWIQVLSDSSWWLYFCNRNPLFLLQEASINAAIVEMLLHLLKTNWEKRSSGRVKHNK